MYSEVYISDCIRRRSVLFFSLYLLICVRKTLVHKADRRQVVKFKVKLIITFLFNGLLLVNLFYESTSTFAYLYALTNLKLTSFIFLIASVKLTWISFPLSYTYGTNDLSALKNMNLSMDFFFTTKIKST